MKRWPLVATFILFIMACASAAYWAMQFFRPPLRRISAPPEIVRLAPGKEAAASLFGGRRMITATSNFQLKGVVVAGKASESVAILAAAGRPAQAVITGSEVAPGVNLIEVHPDHVLLSEGGVVKRIEVHKDAKARAEILVSKALPDIK